MAKEYSPNKVSFQQQRALTAMKIKEHFLKVFWNNFWEQVDTWLGQGDQLIIAGDWNTDIREKKF